MFLCFMLLTCLLCFCSRATMELQIKTAMQMRDQGHALKQKALDLVSEAEQKVGVRSFHSRAGGHQSVPSKRCCCVHVCVVLTF